MITHAKNCVDLGRRETLRKKDRWWRYRELIDSKYLTIFNVLSSWKNLKKRIPRRRDPKSLKKAKSKLDAKAKVTNDTELYSLHWTTKLKQRKLIKANTLLFVTEIGGRIAIKHSKEFPRILNSLRSLHKVDLWLFYHRVKICGFTRWKSMK